jgi:hypothetical protein
MKGGDYYDWWQNQCFVYYERTGGEHAVVVPYWMDGGLGSVPVASLVESRC